MAYSLNQLETESLYSIVLNEIIKRGKCVQQQVLKWSQANLPWLSIEEHPNQRQVNKIFTRSERERLRNRDINSYDVTLLHKYLIHFCLSGEGIGCSNLLKTYLISFKNFRNSFVHEEYKLNYSLFHEKVEELKHILVNILINAAELFSIDPTILNDLVTELNYDINNIRDIQFGNLSKNSFVLDLKQTYYRYSFISPSSNLLCDLSDVRVNCVFTKMKITLAMDKKQEGSITQNYGEQGRDEYACTVEYNTLLEIVQQKQKLSGKSNMAVLVEGPPGVGKTTLTRKMISDWSSEIKTMEHLTDFDFVILVECRDQNITSLVQLLTYLMPNASEEIPQENLLKNFDTKKLLFLIDGFDELNSASEKVLREILEMRNWNDIMIICTSRADDGERFQSLLPDNFAFLNMEIKGIEELHKEEFVTKYCQALYFESEKTRNVLVLLNFLMRKNNHLRDEWMIPFNLVLLIILWFSDPDIVNRLTSATELFVETHKLSQRKLESRLFSGIKERHLDTCENRHKIRLFLKSFYREALISHMNDNTGLDDSSLHRLQCICENLKMPSDKVLSAFLMKNASLSDEVNQRYSFPHKGLQDFYAALFIYNELDFDIAQITTGFENILQSHSIPKDYSDRLISQATSILKEFEGIRPYKTIVSILNEIHHEDGRCLKENINLRSFQNIFIHITGLFYHQGISVQEKRESELVTLFKDSGLRRKGEWLRLLSIINCRATLAEQIASMIDLTGVIKFSDTHIYAYTKILQFATPDCVIIVINGKPQDVPLQDVFKHLKKSWNVQVHLEEDFKNPKSATSDLDNSLKQLFERCRLTHFTGLLGIDAAAFLPNTLEYLSLSVLNTNHYKSLEILLTLIPSRFPKLKHLWLHILRVEPSELSPLPAVEILELTLANIGESSADWACQAIQKLQPCIGYKVLKFPDAAKNISMCEQLINELAKKMIKFDSIEVSPHVGEEQHLIEMCRAKLGRCMIMLDDDHIWEHWY